MHVRRDGSGAAGRQPLAEAVEEALAPWRRVGRLPYAPGAELPGQRILSGWHSVNGELVAFILCAGRPFDPAGPFLTVRTALTGDDLQGEVLSGLDEVIEDERDRLFEWTGLDEGDGPRAARIAELYLPVDGVPAPARVRVEQPREGGGPELWAAQLTLDRRGGPLELTVTGRGVPVPGVTLVTVSDVAPYLAGRARLSAETAARSAALAEAERAVPVGLEAHRRLAVGAMERATVLAQQLSAGRTPRTPRRLRAEDRGGRWEDAVRQQMRLASEERQQADQAVASMVNQLVRLAERTDWALGTEDGRQAVEETVRHTVFGSEVPSLRAQQAWQALWAARPRGPSEVERYERSLAHWLAAWESWRRSRHRG
ncbi:hypothetical protein ACIQGZ_25130 [Streptomyces sp. NPDC092296]|uniref:hypothetical protein n=1 Tax=Streptomyces sp. NPDC092296 TaxID=3366012 RepID=UPI00380E5437